MDNKYFTHLHLHSTYSILDGLGKAEDYVSKAAELGMSALALTDHGNVDGCIQFQKECKKRNIKPIFGVEAYIVEDLTIKEKGEKRSHITLLAQNLTGWHNIMKMLSVANINGFYYRPRIDTDLLLENCEGLAIGSACASSYLNWPRWRGVNLMRSLQDKGAFVYLELMPIDMDIQRKMNNTNIELSQKYNIPLVATNDCHYVNKEDNVAHEVLLAIQSKKKWNDPTRWRFDVDTLYLQSEEEMAENFRKFTDIQESQWIVAIANTQIISEMCNVELKQIPIVLPDVEIESYEGMPSDTQLMNLVLDGFESRKSKGLIIEDRIDEYNSRLEEELGIICGLNFSAYFLIVYELIDWCNKNNIMVGPGRGSSGGSLVAYSLGITQVDPLKYDLVFSRFISEARIDLPDIDMDFEKRYRHLIIDHLKDLYGEYNVVGITNYLKMKGKSALRKVSKVFDVPMSDVNKACDAIITRSGGDMRSDFSIIDAFGTFEDGINFKKKYPKVAEFAMKMEGLIMSHGRHAAGICISKEDLRTGKQMNYARRSNTLVSNWDKKDGEYQGLMKLDVLGLQSLDVLHETQNLIKDMSGPLIDYDTIQLDDPKVLEEFNRGNCVGIFQFNGNSIMRFCRDIGIEKFEDIVALNALHRPGTLKSGTIHIYKDRKHGIEPTIYPHPLIKDITKDTQGIILYQEQMMRLMYECGKLPWKTTDTIRKACSKSEGEKKLNKFKDDFVNGCIANDTLSKKDAEDIFETIKSFGCIEANTIVYRVAGNQYAKPEIKIKDLYEYFCTSSNVKHRGLRILAMDDDGFVRPHKVLNVVKTGKKVVYRMRTVSNKWINATANHKFLTSEGWHPLSEIEVGDYIKTTNLKKPELISAKGIGSGAHNSKIAQMQRVGNYQTEWKIQAQKLKKKYNGKCQKCGSDHFCEMHHIDENTQYLCNSCHKMTRPKEDMKRFKNGYYTQFEEVVEIKKIGLRNTFDICMDGNPHNFVAAKIITHNSYSFNKCFQALTVVHKASINHIEEREITVEEIYRKWYSNTIIGNQYRRKGLNILQYDSDGKVRPGKIKGIYYNGRRRIITIKTKSGKSIGITSNHRMLTTDGYKHAIDLKIGDELIASDLKYKKENCPERGYPTYADQIVSIKIGKRPEKVYDIEMDTDNHNLIANNLVSHNSHAVEYSMIAYWQMWLRVHYPGEYMAAILSYGNEKHKAANMQEARRLGLKVQLPDINESMGEIWNYDGNKNLLIPLAEIKGIGPKAVSEIISARNEGQLFKSPQDLEDRVNKRIVNVKIRRLLIETYCFEDKNKLELNENQLEELSKLFDFSLSNDPMYKYRKILKLINKYVNIKTIQEANQGDLIWGFVDKITYQIKTKGEEGIAYSGCYGQLKDETNYYIMMNFDRNLYKEKKEEIEHAEGKWMVVRVARKRQDSITASAIWFADDLLQADFNGLTNYIDGKQQKIQLAKQLNIPGPIIDLQDDIPFKLENCTMCELHKDFPNTIYPDEGNINAMIINEFPRKTEDSIGMNFVGDMGDLLWFGDKTRDCLGLYGFGIERKNIWVSSFVKCHPSQIKTPKLKHVKACQVWWKKEVEIVKPFVILAFGNTGLQAIKGEKSGIMSASGKIEWNDELNCFVIYCLHPAAALYNEDNAEIYNKGIISFLKVYLEAGFNQ